jgi:hypothetical protein
MMNSLNLRKSVLSAFHSINLNQFYVYLKVSNPPTMKKYTLRSLLLIAGIFISANLYAGGINTVCPTINVTFKTTSVLCYGGATGKAIANATGGKTPYTYSWNTGSTKDSAVNLAAGTYTVSVTDSNSCVATATVAIT